MSSGGFELRGTDEDETRVLEHLEQGYSIAIPGHPELVDGGGVVARMADVPMELSFRMDELPIETNVVEHLPALMRSHVDAHAQHAVEPVWSRDRLLPDGASLAMRCTYALAGDPAAMELLAIVLKQGRHEHHALRLTARYRTAEMSPFGWANVLAALLFHQSWNPVQLPSTRVWPERSTFASRSARFELTEAAATHAGEKARELGDVDPADAERVGSLALEWAQRDVPPSDPVSPESSEQLAAALAQAAPRLSGVLLRGLQDVQTQHDLRGWLWQSFVATDSGRRSG